MFKMLKKTPLLPLVILLGFCASLAEAQKKRGPSTLEERNRAVEMATFLEKNPLAKEAKKYRETLLYFLIEVPDIEITICANVLGDLKNIKGDYQSELVAQLTFSQAKFIIENPDKAQDHASVYLAGVEGVLRTWQAIKVTKPNAKFALMDELLQKQQAGTLEEHVRDAMKGCK